MEHYLVYIAFGALIYCMYSARIARMGITMPMVFLTFGVGAGIGGAAFDMNAVTTFHHLAEVTLAVLLFADATTLRRDALRKIGQQTRRMLFLGLPLTIAIGTAINLILLPHWPIWQACLLAALLAPTDAALGQAIRSNDRIPQTLRNAMNAESGLNDGLALPFVIFFAGLAAGEAGQAPGEGVLIVLVATQIGIGATVGLLGGFAIGTLRNHVVARKFMNDELGQVGVLVLVGFIFFTAELVGGNSFVAVFVSGVTYANAVKSSINSARHFLEGDGQFLAMLTFFFIGALFVPEAWAYLTPAGLIVVTLSLSFVRPTAIWISLLGTKTPNNVRLFYGWFGPRGLATALFAVFVAMDFEGLPMVGEVVVISIAAVLISAFAHGITAKYATELFSLEMRSSGDE